MKKFNVSVILIPTIIIVALSALIMILPEQSTNVIMSIRNFLGNNLSVYYLLFGLLAFVLLLYFAFSKTGSTKLGNAKPMNTFTWGSLIFTSTMAADILFYALHEWTYYWNANISDIANTTTTSSKVLWSETYSFFHWGFIPWAFYLVLAIVYAYFFYKKRHNKRQSLAYMCEPVLKDKVNKAPGKIIDSVSILGLLCGTSTTFSVATPLMTAIVCKLFGLVRTPLISVIILVVIAIVYGIAVLIGNKGIGVLAKITTILFSCLIALFFIFGGPQFIAESGLQGIGNMLQHFFQMSTWTDPCRISSFAQDWTTFYWSYWIAWCIATPFFIAKISKGRTIKQVAVGGLLSGLLGTFMSFIVLGGFGMNLQVTGTFDAATMIANGASPADMIVEMISTSQIWYILLPLLLITMLGLYATTFDALVDVVSSFTYKELPINKSPSVKVKLFWIVIFLALPISLLFLETTNQLLMSVSIIAAFPITLIMLLIVISFFKDIKGAKNVKNRKNTKELS